MNRLASRLKLMGAAASMALLLAACGGSAEPGGGGTSADPGGQTNADSGSGSSDLDGTLTIGAVLPLTGSSATIGKDQQRGIELAVADVNASGGVLGKELKVQIEDSEGRAESAIQAAQKLVNVDGVKLVLGEYSSGISIPMQQFLQERGIVGVNPGSSSGLMRENGDLQFSTIGLDNVSGGVVADTIWEEGYKTMAIIAPNNAYGSGVSSSVKKFFEEHGGKVKETILYNEGESDYRQDLERLRASDPEIYVVTMYGQDGTIVNRQMYELGMNEPSVFHIYMSMDVPDAEPASVEGHWGMDAGKLGKLGAEYSAKYEKAYNEPFLSAFNGFAYDAAMISAKAINEAGSDDPKAVAAALSKISAGYEGVTGPVEFDEDGQRKEQGYIIADVRDGKIVPRDS